MTQIDPPQLQPIRRLLIANRGEIAIRVMRAATELGITTVAIYSNEDRFSLHRTKADESYPVGAGKGPIDAYLDIEDVIRIALEARCDAIHPGYGFLAENPTLAERCGEVGIKFIGPSPRSMKLLGNKVAARNLAMAAQVPVMPATGPLPDEPTAILSSAAGIGYPLMLKASWGGGGRGMRVVESADGLLELVAAARREAKAAFGNDEVYLEKLVRRARHLEVQLLGDASGQLVHLWERDCTVQRRNQKVVERAPAAFLTDAQRQLLCELAVKIGRAAQYVNAGTVEFLQDADSGEFYFIEVNPRIQVEHTVTEQITGIDIVKAQIHIAEGARIGTAASAIPSQENIRINGFALQCRVTTEDPENGFIPDYGKITAYRSPAGFGVRLDAGTAYAGAFIGRSYDSLLVKVTTWAPTTHEVIARMHRALLEFRIRGVLTNLRFLDRVISHPQFESADYTTRFIDTTPELFQFAKRRDRATRILNYIADVIVNGNAEVKDRIRPVAPVVPVVPKLDRLASVPSGSKQLLERAGPAGVQQWLLSQTEVRFTDTTLRDAHQSLLATRMRSFDLNAVAAHYAHWLPELFSLECWGGATFDVAMRFLKEDPWERLATTRAAVPNLLLQMLLRSSNAVGYTNYPDNVVRYFIRTAAAQGIDVFRIFDPLNWIDNMRLSIDEVASHNKIAEAAICYTGRLSDPNEKKYTLAYYVKLAKELEKAGAHILGIKDMAGLCRPNDAALLIRTLRQEVGLPLHFHTHDTSGIAAASVLAAIGEGCHAIDAAMDSMSGLTSQPNLGSIVEALRDTPRASRLNAQHLRTLSQYWEQVRAGYVAFESDIRAGTSDVYSHGMPGGQYTNLREQARGLGIDDSRWGEVARAYAEVNAMLGDIIKVTPSSKMVGDLAIMMVTKGYTREQIEDPTVEVSFPESVVQYFAGEMGQPYGGFPASLQHKVLKGRQPLQSRPGEHLAPVDLAAERDSLSKRHGVEPTDTDLASHLMYPKVFADYYQDRMRFGNLALLPTSVFFYGLKVGQEVCIDLEKGKQLIVTYVAQGALNDDGTRSVMFELNGQPRSVRVADRSMVVSQNPVQKARLNDPTHVGAPMPGQVLAIQVTVGQRVSSQDLLLSLEAMKMETAVRAERAAEVVEVLVRPGQAVEAKDLLIVLKPLA